MNYFFFLHREGLANRLNIPKFRNDGGRRADMELFAARVSEGRWNFFQPEVQETEHFWFPEADDTNQHDLFFICTKSEFEAQCASETLIHLNTYTEMAPDYRCNISISNAAGAETSYQSEYPFKMIKARGGLTSSIDTLWNASGETNGVFIRNVFHEPINEIYSGQILDTVDGRVRDSIELTTNMTNFVDLSRYHGKRGLYLTAKGFLGIPVYFSQSHSGALSLEHTHPPHESVQGANIAKRVKEYRDAVAKKVR